MVRKILIGLTAILTIFSTYCLCSCNDNSAESNNISDTSSEDEETKKEELKKANAYAKTCCNTVSVYFTDLEASGKTVKPEELDGEYDLSKNDGSDKLLDTLVANLDTEKGLVYIKAEKNNNDLIVFRIQYKESSDSKIIGMYPDAFPTVEQSENAQWGVFEQQSKNKTNQGGISK